MSTSETPKLICSACNHENETERVYCHNCGEKLDRSLLPKVEAVKDPETMAEEEKRVRKMMNPNRMAWRREVRTFALIVLFSAIVAAVYLLCQPPENVPLEKSDRIPDRDAGDLWSQMMESRPAVSVTFSEFEINYYLQRSIKSSEGPLGLKFKRAFVSFAPGAVTLTSQRDAFGRSMFSSVTFKPVLADGKWTANIKGMHIGRLGIHPALGRFATSTLGGLAKAFEKEKKQLDRLASIEPGEAMVTFVTKPAQ